MSLTETLTRYNDSDDTENAERLWDLFRVALTAGRNVLAYGPPGTGKTTTAYYYGLGNRKALRHQCKPGETVYDVLGDMALIDGSTVFRKGTFAIAVENGYRLVIDEVDRASEDVLAMLYSVGDGKPFSLSDGTEIVPHAETQVAMTTNLNPWELYPPDSGIRDRFPFIQIPEPSREALDTLPSFMRDTVRRSVRAGITGFRAWQHLIELFSDYGYEASELLLGAEALANDVAIALPSSSQRESVVRLVSGAVFGENASEIMRAFRVAATREHETALADAKSRVRPTALDGYVREAYEAGRSAGLAEGLSEQSHSHDVGACDECQAMYYDGADNAECSCEHEHDISECRYCESLYDDGYSSGYDSGANDHSHDSDNDGTCLACDDVWSAGYETAIDALYRLGADVLSRDDVSAIADLIREEVGQ